MTEAGFTQEELALLGHSDLVVEDRTEYDSNEEHLAPPGFRERLALGDLSW